MRDALRYDWHNRYSLLDHILHPDTTLRQMEERTFRELGDFVNQPYIAEAGEEHVKLRRNGALYTDEGIIPLTIEKELSIRDWDLHIAYRLAGSDSAETEFLFAPEFNFSMLSGIDELISYVSESGKLTETRLDGSGSTGEGTGFGIDDNRRGMVIRIHLDRPAAFWYFPAHTISQSESGFELNYQSSVIIPHWSIRLKPGEEKRFKIVLSVRKMKLKNRVDTQR